MAKSFHEARQEHGSPGLISAPGRQQLPPLQTDGLGVYLQECEDRPTPARVSVEVRHTESPQSPRAARKSEANTTHEGLGSSLAGVAPWAECGLRTPRSAV